MDREGWWAAVHGVSQESNTTERLSTHAGCVQLAFARETGEGGGDSYFSGTD